MLCCSPRSSGEKMLPIIILQYFCKIVAIYGYNPLEGERRDAGGVEVLPAGQDVRGRRAEGEIHSRHIRPGRTLH